MTMNQSNKSRRIIIIICSILIAIVLIEITFRLIAANRLHRETELESVPNVSVIKANRGPSYDEIILPGTVQAWHEATIYARTNGYIKNWLVDIGTHVKSGALLAVIETPEIDEQLRQARADLKTAQANNDLAQVTAKRWIQLVKTDSVSVQETDEKIDSARALQSTVNSLQANVQRLQYLVGFQKVTAPFEGVITLRNIDIGSLIDAGTASRSLFRIAQANPLRIYVKVPQNDAQRISRNMQVSLFFNDHPGKSFPAKLFQTAEAIDPNTRTLLTQFTANNAKYELLPGGYTEVHLKLPIPPQRIRVPVNTLVFRAAGLQVATVDNSNKVLLKNITVSRDFGSIVEVSSGIKLGDRVIVNPPDFLFNGQKVNVTDSKGAKPS